MAKRRTTGRKGKTTRSVFKKGKPKTGGRKKGTPNKATQDVRKAIAMIAQNQVEKLQGWIERAARKDPAKGADLFLRMIEYHIPKLNRTEHVGGDGPPIQQQQLPADPQQALEMYFDFIGASPGTSVLVTNEKKPDEPELSPAVPGEVLALPPPERREQ